MIVEIGTWGVSLLCGAALLVSQVEVNATRKTGLSIGSPMVRAQPSTVRVIHAEKNLLNVAENDNAIGEKVMGRLEVKSIGLTVPILDDFDPSSLRKGVGHIHGTALPGGLGNMALAGHRDTFFRPLRNIRKGMLMSVFTGVSRYDYIVDSMEIVNPEQVSVLEIHEKPEMTLITCYPFDFIGSAPHRFIVQAHLESLEPARK